MRLDGPPRLISLHQNQVQFVADGLTLEGFIVNLISFAKDFQGIHAHFILESFDIDESRCTLTVGMCFQENIIKFEMILGEVVPSAADRLSWTSAPNVRCDFHSKTVHPIVDFMQSHIGLMKEYFSMRKVLSNTIRGYHPEILCNPIHGFGDRVMTPIIHIYLDSKDQITIKNDCCFYISHNQHGYSMMRFVLFISSKGYFYNKNHKGFESFLGKNVIDEMLMEEPVDYIYRNYLEEGPI